MSRMYRYTVLLVLIGLVVGCDTQPTILQYQQTAEIQGCWTYGAPQPFIPTPSMTATTNPVITPTSTAIPTATPWGNPTATATRRAWVECTPLPATPTRTPTPRPTQTPRPPETPAAYIPPPSAGTFEIGDFAGSSGSYRGAMSTYGDMVVTWNTWGFAENTYAGDVWYRVYRGGEWLPAQTVNPTPTAKDYGGVAAVFQEQRLILIWGDYSQRIWMSESADFGATWVHTQTTYRGTVLNLESNSNGLHLLFKEWQGGEPPQFALRYARFTHGQWMDEYTFNAFGYTSVMKADGNVLWVATGEDGGTTVHLYQRVGLTSWSEQRVEAGTSTTALDLHIDSHDHVLVLAVGPIGRLEYPRTVVVTSYDGGMTWDTPVILAEAGLDTDRDGNYRSQVRSGYRPFAIYDRTTHAAGIIWHQYHDTTGLFQAMFAFHNRSTNQWEGRILDTEQFGLPLTSVGWLSYPLQPATSHHIYLLDTETRNGQNRLILRSFDPTSMIRKGTS